MRRWTRACPVATKICTLAGETISDKLRAAYMVEYQDRINAAGPFIPIMQPPAVRVASANLTGLNANGIWDTDLTKIGLKN